MAISINLKRIIITTLRWPAYIVIKCIQWLMGLIPGMGPYIRETWRAMEYQSSVEKCTEQERRYRRHCALLKQPFAESFTLWAEEAEDLLYHRHDPKGALKAFQNALRAGVDGSFMVGSWQVYGGAAQAAIMAGNHEAAREYTQKLAEEVQLMQNINERSKGGQREYGQTQLEWCNEVLNWLRSELGEEGSD